MPVRQQDWHDVTYAGGLWGAACNHSGRSANPVPVGIDNDKCTNCNWMMAGCRFDTKQSLWLNYLPAAIAHGARIRPLHEVQKISRTDGGDFRVHFNLIDDETTGSRPAAAPSTPRSSSSPPAPARPRSSCNAPRRRSARCRARSAATSPATANA
jgi:hypothetical protein